MQSHESVICGAKHLPANAEVISHLDRGQFLLSSVSPVGYVHRSVSDS